MNNNKNEYELDLFGKFDTDWTRIIQKKLNIQRRTCTTFIPKISPTTDQYMFLIFNLLILHKLIFLE